MPIEIGNLLSESKLKEQAGDMNLALELAQEALQHSQQENLTDLYTQSRVQLAHLLTRIGRYSEAYKIAEDILQENRNNTEAVEALIILEIGRAHV